MMKKLKLILVAIALALTCVIAPARAADVYWSDLTVRTSLALDDWIVVEDLSHTATQIAPLSLFSSYYLPLTGGTVTGTVTAAAFGTTAADGARYLFPGNNTSLDTAEGDYGWAVVAEVAYSVINGTKYPHAYLNGNTFTGTHDFSGATLKQKDYFSFVIPAPAEADDINIMKAPQAMTITKIDCIVQGTTSVTGQLQECDSAGANCADLDSDITCDADGAADDGSFTDAAIASGAWLRWKTTSVSGTPTFLTVTVKFTAAGI